MSLRPWADPADLAAWWIGISTVCITSAVFCTAALRATRSSSRQAPSVVIDQVLWLLFGVIMGASMLLVAGDGPDAHVRVALVLNISAMAWSVTTVVRSFFLLSVAPLCGIPALILVVQRDQEDVLLACGCATVFLLCVFYHQTSSRTVRTLFTLQDQLSYDNAELAKEVDAISQLSFRDDLTGAFNRRHLDEVLRTTLDRAGIDREPFVFALVDLDNFKQLNDRLGHAAGDEALVRFVATAQAILRSSDCFARLGGDEFALLLPRTTYDTGVQIVERLRAVVHEASIPAGASILTFSAGVIEHRGATQGSIDEGPLVLADRALYAAKRAGRDQVRGHGGAPPTLAEPATESAREWTKAATTPGSSTGTIRTK